MGRVTYKLRVTGIVQGVGFRPAVSRLAKAEGHTGTVCNRGSYVEIILQGDEEKVRSFPALLMKNLPERAIVTGIEEERAIAAEIEGPNTEELNIEEMGEALTGKTKKYSDFRIIESHEERGEIFISPDIATCDTCAKELYEKSGRRYLHPFINCTACGPRLTILDALPYDRERTSMKKFPMCPDCAKEYVDPASRRYDAQPVCCNSCGPEVYLLHSADSVRGLDAIREVRRVIREGGVAAVKGVGGFHLCCDAGNAEAVGRLRKLKNRPAKPFAVMMRDIDTVRRFCEVNESRADLLTGHQKPIVLLERKKACAGLNETSDDRRDGRDSTSSGPIGNAITIAEEVAPGQPTLGVMLPYAPIHYLLFRLDEESDAQMPDCLVMTSGNAGGAPIAASDEEALEELAGFADVILSNNRTIRTRCDDSVVDYYEGEPYMIRRSRGYAPLPVIVPGAVKPMAEPEAHTILAVGGELKNTFCIGRGELFYPSSYIGDLEDIRSQNILRETIRRMETLLEAKTDAVVCDLHPGYFSTKIAEEIAAERGIPLLRVQHHYAHVLSCMAENKVTGPVIGISFDGTGYGTDGTIWGGEILLANEQSFRRVGSIVPFLHAGGDVASKEGWRIAVSMLRGICASIEEALETAERLGVAERRAAEVLFAMMDAGINTIESTSCGRLFDAVSCVLGFCRESTYEGDAAAKLMIAAERGREMMGDALTATEQGGEKPGDALTASKRGDEKPDDAMTAAAQDERFLLRTDLLFREIVNRRLGGEDADILAYIFHERLAELTCEAAGSAEKVLSAGRAEEHRAERSTVALTGGCFQNKLLLDLTEKKLRAKGFRVIRHHQIPVNDGGISLGQAVFGMKNSASYSR